MRPGRCLLAAACTVIGCMAPAPSEAVPGIEVHGGWSRHAMGGVNDSLGSLNASIGTDLGPIRGGTSWGIGLRQWAGRDVLVRLEFEKLEAATADPIVRFNLGAHVYSVSATRFMTSPRRVRLGLGLGLGLCRAWGGVASLETSGYGYGARAAAEAIIPIGGICSLHGALGYRRARILNVKVGQASSDIDPDYSGVFLRIGIAVDGPQPDKAEWP